MRRLIPLVLVLPLLALPALGVAPLHLAAAVVGEPTVPAGAVSSGGEPSILVLEHAPYAGRILVGDFNGLHRSDDGGVTWRDPTDREFPLVGINGNPGIPGAFIDGWTMAEDDAGNVYASTTTGEFIFVATSHDGGATWSQVNRIAAYAVIADRPWLAASGDGHVVLVQNALAEGEQCMFSDDHGLTFSQGVLSGIQIRVTQKEVKTLNQPPPNAGNVLLDSAGRVLYSNGGGFYRWTSTCTDAEANALPASGPQIFSQLALTSTGALVTAQPTPDSSAMQIVGETAWGGTMRSVTVSTPGMRSNTFGSIAARPGVDEIAVTWLASSSGGNPSASGFTGTWDLYLGRVTGFATGSPTVSAPIKITSTPNHSGWFCMGGVSCTSGRNLADYFGVTYDPAGNVHMAYGKDIGPVQVLYATVPRL